MNGTASANATNESVGKPGRLGRRLEPARVHEQEQHREDQREDDRRGLAARAHDRATRDRADLRGDGAHAAVSAASCSSSPAPSSERPGLGEEDVVERWRLDLEVGEREARVVDRADDPRQPGQPLAEPDDHVAGAAVERLAEGGERGDEPLALGVVERGRRGRSAARSLP